MERSNRRALALSCAIVAGGVGLTSWAGSLAPPAGQVSSTMTTLKDISRSVDGLGCDPIGRTPAFMRLVAQPTIGEVIQGEDTVGGVPGSIEVFSWSWRQTNPGPGPNSGSALGDLSIVKEADSASAQLMHACASGASFDEVEIQFFSNNADPASLYLTFTMKNTSVTSYQFGGSQDSGSNSYPMEEISFNWEEFKTTYIPTNRTSTLRKNGMHTYDPGVPLP